MTSDSIHDQRPQGSGSRWYATFTAGSVACVLPSPFSVYAGPEVLVPWLWVNTAVTAAIAVLNWVRPAWGCVEILVPMIATCVLVGIASAQWHLVGTALALTHGAALVVLVLGWRRVGRSSGSVVP